MNKLIKSFLIIVGLVIASNSSSVHAIDTRYTISKSVICANSIRKISDTPLTYSGNIRYRVDVKNNTNVSKTIGIAYFGWDWDGQTIFSSGSTGDKFTVPARSTVTRYKTISLVSMSRMFSVAIHKPSNSFLFDWIYSDMTFGYKDSQNPIPVCQ